MRTPIYSQKQPGVGELSYGLRKTADVGCGWVAAYNAMVLLGRNPRRDKLRRYFLWHGAMLFGVMGTILPAPGLYFRKLGYTVKFIGWRRRFDQAIRDADVAIVWYRWRNGTKFGAHFITVQWDGREFVGYNNYANSQGSEHLGLVFLPFWVKRDTNFQWSQPSCEKNKKSACITPRDVLS